MTFFIKLHNTPQEVITAVCDADILGQTFRGNGLRIEVSNGFYGGESATEDDVKAAFRSASTLNLVGNRVVDLAIGCGVVDPDSVLVVGGVKHAQVVRV